jgi:hypothetical protein
LGEQLMIKGFRHGEPPSPLNGICRLRYGRANRFTRYMSRSEFESRRAEERGDYRPN